MKPNLLLISILLVTVLFSQIKITEVNYDTPFEENNDHVRASNGVGHLGEYIELYNYTFQDINLNGWFVDKGFGRFYFPSNVTIKSGGFLIVAYKPKNYPDYFTSFFPTTAGKESQIIYQDVIELRNNKGTINIGTNNLGGVSLFYISDDVEWAKGDGNHILFHYFNVNGNQSSNTNTYYNISLHTNPTSSSHNYFTADPLEESDVPAMVNLFDIPSVQQAYLNYYSFITWGAHVQNIVNNTCPISIPLVQQTPAGSYSNAGKCFNYDANGNMTNGVDCYASTPPSPPSAGYTEQELADIENDIQLYPNPTSNILNVSWGVQTVNKISSIEVVAINGGYYVNTPIVMNQNSLQLNLGAQQNGIFIVRVMLTTGQFVSKNVMKI